MHKGAAHFADAVTLGSEALDTTQEYLSVSGPKPVLPFTPIEEALPTYLEFFRNLTQTEIQR
jgi:hypothetical protein